MIWFTCYPWERVKRCQHRHRCTWESKESRAPRSPERTVTQDRGTCPGASTQEVQDPPPEAGTYTFIIHMIQNELLPHADDDWTTEGHVNAGKSCTIIHPSDPRLKALWDVIGQPKGSCSNLLERRISPPSDEEEEFPSAIRLSVARKRTQSPFLSIARLSCACKRTE